LPVMIAQMGNFMRCHTKHLILIKHLKQGLAKKEISKGRKKP